MIVMPSSADVNNGQRIADWTTRYGTKILPQITAACARLESATSDYESTPVPAALAEVRAAGKALAAIASQALAGPFSGVAGLDGPRKDGLELYRRGGEMVATWDPETNDVAGFNGGILISKGTEITAAGTQYTADLMQRIVNS